MEQAHSGQNRTHEPELANTQTCSSGMAETACPTRRELLTGTLAVSSLALSGLPQPAAAQTSTSELQKIGELSRSPDGKLRCVITLQNEERQIPADPAAKTQARTAMLRYFEGKDAAGTTKWPPATAPGTPRPLLPGPTLRARVGDQIQITYFNHVRVEDFPGGTIDRLETGDPLGCDAAVGSLGEKIYPEGAGDSSPDCFHGSSTVNLHFHGTHVTPDGLGDNVLLQLRPNPNVVETDVKSHFEEIFRRAELGLPLANWNDLPEGWRDFQLDLLQQYDNTAIWQGKRGTPENPSLPPDRRLLPPTEALIRGGHWPQYQIGAYPFAFKLTEYSADAQGKPTRYVMGQSPGTHWYHAHKHGSTAINVLNGMAGVFIIEGDYDRDLEKIYPNLKQTEKVLIVQNFSDSVNAMTNSNPSELRKLRDPPSLWVNGQLNPTITMGPGEIQLWRFVNASIRAVTTVKGFTPVNGKQPEMRQIAQDGVQFHWANYDRQPLLKPSATGDRPRANTFAPGNRMDLLVRAPIEEGNYEFQLTDTTGGFVDTNPTLLTLRVAGSKVTPAMEFPTKENYPSSPPFLGDIGDAEIKIWRKLEFSWERGREHPFRLPPPDNAPKFMIDGKQFLEGRYDQTMVLGDVEEWKLLNNTTKIAHPFHIHINPFQVVEVFEPGRASAEDKTYNTRPVWQDVVAIPPGVFRDGAFVPGYVKIRARFVDFPGSYVLHCHMLAHEDRGMMQLVRVISGETTVHHH